MPISTIGSNSLNQTSDLTINGVTVGEGGGSVSTNTAVGASALAANTTGASNTAIGSSALQANTTASNNTAVGYQAGIANTTGRITAFGHRVLYGNTTGTGNTGVGGNDGSVGSALLSNTTGSYNTGIGVGSLLSNTTSSYNTAVGYQAGYSAVTADYNTFVGYYAGRSTTGDQNTFLGKFAGNAITTGSQHTIIGAYNGNQGGLDIRTSTGFIVLSDGGGTPRVYLNNDGSTFIPRVYIDTTASSANVVVRSDGLLYRSTSALKYKQDVRDLDSIDITKFRPVRYKSKCETDDQTKDHFGIVADEVHDAGIKELVNYGAEGEVEGFQYERLTVVLLKSLQELKTIVDAQAAEIAELKAKVA